jgi:predicted kinase
VTAAPRMTLSSVVIVNGLPASGKSTLAAELSRQTGLVIVSKDLIKETLSQTLRGSAPAIAQASIAVMYALAAASPALILDSFFTRTQSEADLLALQKPILEVFCQVDPKVGKRRFFERIESGDRHEVHDNASDDQRYDHWVQSGSRPTGLFPCRVVDTSKPTPVAEVADVARWLCETDGNR